MDQQAEHLALYHRADIALDPFPFTGATTTFQALWMGLPVITLAGRRFIQRMAADIVIHAGLPSLATHSEEVYLAQAVALAGDRPALKALRAGLRQQLMNAPLCDGSGYARSVEQAYLEMWKQRRGGTTP